MDIEHYKQTHLDILGQIASLRRLINSGIDRNAEDIANLIISMSSGIRFHLAAEDKVLYPALGRSSDPAVAKMGAAYQVEMEGIATAFRRFVDNWRVWTRIAADPEGFRHEANGVFRALFERLQREDRELYPAAESL